MAAKYDWGDGKGKIHSISKADHDKNVAAQRAAKTRVAAPPAGSYDPNLDAQKRAETRGYENTLDDLDQAGEYAGIDLGIAKDSAGISKTRNLEDYTSAKSGVERSSGRSLTDLLTNRTRGGEDYKTSLSNLQRTYDRLGTAQGEQARKAGAEATGGAFAQAARKRAANQALDKSPIDLAYNRFMADSGTAETRLGEDKQTSLDDLLRGYTRGDQDVDRDLAATTLGFTRQTRDYETTRQRAGDEHDAFGQDIDTAKQYQWGGEAFTGAGTPVKDPFAPAATTVKPPKAPASTLGAGPGFPNSKKKRRGRTVTYTAQTGAP